MIYMFIDPSGSFTEGKGHTGIAWMENDDWDSLTLKDVAAKDYSSRFIYWRSIIDEIKRQAFLKGKDNIEVIIESFQIRTNGFLMGKMPETIMLIGAIVWELDYLGIKYTFQTPSQAKGRFKDDSLCTHIPNFEKRDTGRYYFKGKPTNDHIRDALKHLLYFKRYRRDK